MNKLNLAIIMCAATSNTMANNLPDGFVYLDNVSKTIIEDMRYFGRNNFIGRPVDGYESPRCILTKEAANALIEIQDELVKSDLSLKVFDCYRPQRSVNFFKKWSGDFNDQKNKKEYYPNINKNELFAKGYIIEKSGHSRGSTVDLTVVAIGDKAKKSIPGAINDSNELDMGTNFDWFGVESNTDNPNLPLPVKENRKWFKNIMETHGFKNLPEEWWHFTLKKEPFPSTYFDFPVK